MTPKNEQKLKKYISNLKPDIIEIDTDSLVDLPETNKNWEATLTVLNNGKVSIKTKEV